MHCRLPKRQSMALTIHITHGCGLSNKMRHRLHPKKTYVGKAVLAVNIKAKGVTRAVHY